MWQSSMLSSANRRGHNLTFINFIDGSEGKSEEKKKTLPPLQSSSKDIPGSSDCRCVLLCVKNRNHGSKENTCRWILDHYASMQYRLVYILRIAEVV